MVYISNGELAVRELPTWEAVSRVFFHPRPPAQSGVRHVFLDLAPRCPAEREAKSPGPAARQQVVPKVVG